MRDELMEQTSQSATRSTDQPERGGSGSAPLTVSCAGPVDARDMRAAAVAVRRALARHEAGHDRVEVHIVRATNPSHSTPYAIEVEVSGPGRDIRAGAAGATIDEAAAEVHARLRRLLSDH